MHTFILIFLLFFKLNLNAQVTNWNQYPYSDPASTIKFPIDEGTHHTIIGLEWWYVVIHAVGEKTGNKYSILVTHFNNNTRFFNVTNVTKKTHVSGSTFGLLKSQAGHLDLTQQTPFGIDLLRTKRNSSNELIPFQYEMQTHYKDIQLNAELKSNKKPMMVGLDGYGPVGESGNTWYYSLTNITLRGELTYQGIKEPIHGQAWMDHQWGPFLVSPIKVGNLFESYEWFSIQLSRGYEVMISNIYNRNNELPEGTAYGDVQLFDPEGRSYIADKSIFSRTHYWQDPNSKKYFSMGWTLQVPEWKLDLNLQPEFEDQMVRFILNGDFWEGSIKVSGKLNDLQVYGLAYGELVHQFKKPELQFTNIQKTYNRDQVIDLEWNVTNPDAGNPLNFQVFLILENHALVKIGENINGNHYKFNLPDMSKSKSFKISIKGCSVDHYLCGEAVSDSLKIN